MSRKPKYDIAFKKKIVNLILKRNSILSLADEYSLSKSMVRRWYLLYKQHGTLGLAVTNNSYTPEFKLHVIKYMNNNSLSLTETCVKFNIHSISTLNRWIRLYEREGKFGLTYETRGVRKYMSKRPKKDLTKQEQLLAEIADLKAENAYLKKLHALVQSEKEKDKKQKSSKN